MPQRRLRPQTHLCVYIAHMADSVAITRVVHRGTWSECDAKANREPVMALADPARLETEEWWIGSVQEWDAKARQLWTMAS